MIEMFGISKAYKKNKNVIQDISFQVLPNSICCLLGKNGAGKSTILNIITQITKADSGHVKICGKILTPKTIFPLEKIGVVSQYDNLINQISGYQFLRFQSLLFNIPKDISETRIKTLTEYFFDDFSDIQKQISGYSSGMRLKLRIISSLIHKPAFLIMDEPFAHLDPFSAEKLALLLKQFGQNETNAVLISSHDLMYVEKIATNICVINEGGLIFKGSLGEFTNYSASKIDESLFGLIDKNRISADNLSWLC
jgi:ABC-2 type transport system ATP-binding protein